MNNIIIKNNIADFNSLPHTLIINFTTTVKLQMVEDKIYLQKILLWCISWSSV